MRGGAIPLLVWGSLLVVLMLINLIWTGDAIQAGTFAFAVVVVLTCAGLFVAGSRAAIRRGAPELRPEPEGVPQASLGAALAGFSVATFVFGLVFGRFLIFFGAGLLVAALGRLTLELRSQRRTRGQVPQEPRR